MILPGVGAAGYAMARLHEQGLVEPLRTLQVPLLGVCLGMQLLFEAFRGRRSGMPRLKGVVRHLHAAQGLRIPHMGWNRLILLAESPLLDGLPAGASAYFVHSYAAPVTPNGSRLRSRRAVQRGGAARPVLRRAVPRAIGRHRRAHPTGLLTHDFSARAAA